MLVKCATCGKEVERRPSRNTCKLSYCSRSCSGIGRTKSATRALGKDTYTCITCKLELNTTNFCTLFDNRSNSYRVSSNCKQCRNIIKAKRYRTQRRVAAERMDVRFVLRQLISGSKSRVRNKPIPFSLTLDHLLDLWTKQEGKCYYTNVTMTYGPTASGNATHTSLSIDKLDPAKGYTIGNVVLCTYIANSFKLDMTEQAMYTFCEQVLTTKANREAANSK